MAPARHWWTDRAAPGAIFWAPACALVPPARFLSRAKASRRCCPSARRYRVCLSWQPCPQATSPPSCCRRRCTGSTSPAMRMRRATRLLPRWPHVRQRPASRCWPCRHSEATSTTICRRRASTPCAQPCAPNSSRRTANAPGRDERVRYLCHLKEVGTSRASLRKCANDHLNLVLHLDLKDGEQISMDDVLAAASTLSQPRGRRSECAATAKARQRFISHCRNLLRHIGWVHEVEKPRHPNHDQVVEYEGWLRSVRGLSEASVASLRLAADHFLFWLAERNLALAAVRIVDIDGSVGAEFERGAWSRRTIHNYANRLRTFIAFAQDRGWCRPGLAAGIMAPGFRPDETIPKGIKRSDVIRLLESTQGEKPSCKRDFAVLMLLANYGLRASEVA